MRHLLQQLRATALTMSAMALACFAATASAALPPTGAGSLDPTFGNGGKATFNVIPGSNQDDIGNGIVQPDGKLVVSGYVEEPGTGHGSVLVARFSDAGIADPSFGEGGVTILPIDEISYADSYGPALGPDGRIFAVGGSTLRGAIRCIVVALLPNGTLDGSFAQSGVLHYPDVDAGGLDTNCNNIASQPDGKLVVLGNRDGFKASFVLRLTSTGQLDPTFGTGGVAELPGNGTVNFIYGLSIAPSGAIYVSGGPAVNTPGVVYRLTSSGVMDPSFASGGQYVTAATNVFLHDIEGLADGGAVASGYHSGKHFILRLTAAGVPAQDFGDAGVRELTLGSGYSAVSLAVQRDGKILVGIRQDGIAGHFRFAVVRLTANGALDPAYGAGGVTQIDFGTLDEVLYGIAQAPDGKLWVFGRSDISDSDSVIALARLLPDEITTPIVEFFNIQLVHYFITADPNEAAAVDGGAAGPGWIRTGQTFNSGGPSKAGRFYGNPEPNPATGQRYGPNGHFYSIEPPEIAQVKLDIGWHFESYDFNAWPSFTSGCPAGTIAVMRNYNNRFAQNDSNHRYTTSPVIYGQMVAAGWSGEGTVFCAVQ